MLNTKDEKLPVTPLSRFVRETSSVERERIYKKAMAAASEKQNAVVEKANLAKAAQ